VELVGVAGEVFSFPVHEHFSFSLPFIWKHSLLCVSDFIHDVEFLELRNPFLRSSSNTDLNAWVPTFSLSNIFFISILGSELFKRLGKKGKLGFGSFELSPKSLGNGNIGKEGQDFSPKKFGKLNFGISGQDFSPKNAPRSLGRESDPASLLHCLLVQHRQRFVPFDIWQSLILAEHLQSSLESETFCLPHKHLCSSSFSKV